MEIERNIVTIEEFIKSLHRFEKFDKNLGVLVEMDNLGDDDLALIENPILRVVMSIIPQTEAFESMLKGTTIQ